jgi:hypothetical protein
MAVKCPNDRKMTRIIVTNFVAWNETYKQRQYIRLLLMLQIV